MTRITLAALLLFGFMFTVACNSARHASGPSSRHTCGWRITPLPRADHGDPLAEISQPPRGGAWAIAQGGNVLGPIVHWNGRRWVVVPRPHPHVPLESVLAVSENDVWFAGTGGHIEHWNGRRISVLHDPNGGVVYADQLAGTEARSVWLLSESDDGWPYLAHWNGSAWAQANPPLQESHLWGHISARSLKDLWAVGGINPTSIAHWDGAHWHYVKSPVLRPYGINDVLDLGLRDVWTVGARIYHFNGKTWRATPGPAPYAKDVFSLGPIAGFPGGPLYSVGTSSPNVNSGKSTGLVFRWTGTRWIRVPTAPLPKRSSALSALAVGRHGQVWAAGYSSLGKLSWPLVEHYIPCPSRR